MGLVNMDYYFSNHVQAYQNHKLFIILYVHNYDAKKLDTSQKAGQKGTSWNFEQVGVIIVMVGLIVLSTNGWTNQNKRRD